FNLQAEASIPEDIFDQHDADIGEDAAAQMQYAEPADDEADEYEAADIILESQRPTSRNFTVYLAKDGKTVKKKYHNNNNNNKNHYSYKLKNNKESLPAKRVANEEEAATKSTSGDDNDSAKDNNGKRNDEVDSDNERNGNGNGYGYGYGYSNGNGYGDEDTGEDNAEDGKPNANFDSKSFAYKKFKNMHEQQNQQSQKEQQQQTKQQQQQQQQANANGPARQQEQQERQWQREQQQPAVEQLFDSIEILNERKFNKAPGQSTLLAAEEDVAGEDIMAIGDIEDNFGNDKVLAENIKSAIDNDESAVSKEMIMSPAETSTTATPSTSASASTSTTPTTSSTSTTPATTTTTTTAQAAPSGSSSRHDLLAPIGRKPKRHGNGHSAMSWPGSRSYEKKSYGIGRIHAADFELNAEDVGELHYYDGEQHSRGTEDGAGKAPANYLSSYLGHIINETKQQQHQQKKEQQQQEHQQEQEPQGEQRTSQLELESTLRYHPDATTASPSAFERFKALRRSSRRNGHKSHKKRYKDYLKHSSALSAKQRKDREQHAQKWQQQRQLAEKQEREQEKESEREQQKQQQREQQQEQEKQRERTEQEAHAHASPIFALGVRPQRNTPKPFYEGQVNYYDHQEEQPLQPLGTHHTEMERLIASDNDNWYRRISPVLRNGIKSTEMHKQHHQQQQQHQANHHHHLKHHYHQHHHHKHARQRLPNPYQRKAPAQLATAPTTPQPPLPPPKPQLGHQITELEQLERYYAKWPHLARVQFQVYDEHYREAHPELYGDYDADDDYETAAELEEAQQDHGAEANLPPYIKKYNRRNKQLLNLLEGTLPPPTATPFPGIWSGSQLQPGPHESAPIRVDDEYVKQKRRRYQQRYEDIFAQQHSSGSSTTTPATLSSSPASQLNQLPEEDKQLDEHQLSAAVDFWQREIETKAGPKSPSPHTSTSKPALYKLPLYPAIAGSFLGTPRSRSAQFVANVSGRGQGSWHPAPAAAPVGANSHVDAHNATASPFSPLNSFVYHRVVDGIGAASSSSLSSSSLSRKQRLPFVAITDRRLESVGAHKLNGEQHKELEQNHFPMP
ncbi:hypothetical protein AWZ03_013745, partial [Drosophila navojoa]